MNYFILLLLIFTLNTFYCQNQQQFKNIIDPYFPKQTKYKVGLIVYPNFTTYDLSGPSEIFDDHPELFETIIIGKKANSQVISGHNFFSFQIKMSMEEAKHHEFDIIMIPGADLNGLVILNNKDFIRDYKEIANKAKVVFSVCSGGLILAKTGLIDGIKATTNKVAYPFYTPMLYKVDWVYHARYVHHKRFITSSGITAGIDAALYILSLIKGENSARQYSKQIEYNATFNPDSDPFAILPLL